MNAAHANCFYVKHVYKYVMIDVRKDVMKIRLLISKRLIVIYNDILKILNINVDIIKIVSLKDNIMMLFSILNNV